MSANGDIIGFLNSDDYYLIMRLKQLINIFQKMKLIFYLVLLKNTNYMHGYKPWLINGALVFIHHIHWFFYQNRQAQEVGLYDTQIFKC